MADTTYTTKCYLKGSVQTSIDNSGNITKNFTWMVLNANETNTLLEWLAFQDYVETEWAGKSGDNWKKPVQQAGSKECTAFDSTDDSFIVADLTIETPPGRTHVEVTYTCTGNPNKIKHFTDGGLSINSSDERTKSFSFKYVIPEKQVTLGDDTWTAPDLETVETTIDGLFKINDNVTWADSEGHTYVVDNVSVSQESPSVYNVTVSLKDMAKMRVGLISVNEDSYGQKTISITWRLSKEEYDETDLPNSGDAVGTWVGEGYDGVGYDNYVVTGVEHSPDGNLGYLVTISAKDTTFTRLHTQRDYKWNGTGLEKSANVVYQLHSKEDAEQFLNNLGRETLDVDGESFTVRDANITQSGKDDYELSLSLSDDLTPLIVNIGSNTPDDLDKDIQVSMTYGTFRLTPHQCGLFRSLSNLAYYPINNPPNTKFNTRILVSDLQEMDSRWTNAMLTNIITSPNPRIGFSDIVACYDGSDNKVKKELWSTYPVGEASGVGSKFINSFKLSQYVYPQPTFTESSYGETPKYSEFFVPWVAKNDLLIIPGGSTYNGRTLNTDLSNYPKYDNGLDMALPQRWLNRKIPYMDCTVTMNYRGNLQSNIKKNWDDYFLKAIKQICKEAELIGKDSSSNFNKYFMMPYEKAARNHSQYPLTSFKRTGMSVQRIIDTKGHEWTQITMNIQALCGDYWNYNYKDKVDFE